MRLLGFGLSGCRAKGAANRSMIKGFAALFFSSEFYRFCWLSTMKLAVQSVHVKVRE
jgi:hypothetical protein